MRTGSGDDATPDGRVEGAEPHDTLPSDTAGGGGDLRLSDGQSTAHHTSTTSDQVLPPPPVYPCRDECSRCGKKTPEENTDTTKGQGFQCSCECHANWQNLRPAAHIPPGGADCQPSCGYSGLPCFNCSSVQAHLQPQKGAATEEEEEDSSSSSPDHVPPIFCPQIYTIELMERPATNVGDEDPPPVSHHQQIIVESEDWNARNMGISLVSCAIFIIVFIFLFKILFKGAAGYFW